MDKITLQNNFNSLKHNFKNRKNRSVNTIASIKTYSKSAPISPDKNIKYRLDCKYRKL